MQRTWLKLSTASAVVLVGLAACTSSTSSSGSPTDAEMNTASEQDAGQGAAMDVVQLGANEDAYGAADVIGRDSVNCTGPDNQGWYTCSRVTENGLDILRQFRFWQGTSLGLWWSPALTDSVNHKWSADGTVQGANDATRSITIADTAAGTMVVARPVGIGQQHTWTGAGTFDRVATWSRNSVERTLTHTGTDSVNAVMFQMPRSTNPYPMSGNIVINVQNHFTAGSFVRVVTRRYVITFNGTSTATLQDGGVTCDLALTVPHTVSNCHGS